MRTFAIFLIGLLLDAQSGLGQPRSNESPYRVALPGYHYEFPRDHFNHPDFQTEWWYYTGNLKSANGRRFSFELTFFREGVARDPELTSDWQIEDVYLAHLALSDIDGRRYLHTERLNRSGPGFAGADLGERRIWNGNWQVQWRDDAQALEAVTEQFTLQLALKPLKPPVINGQDGVSQKSAGRGQASHYISLPRLEANGTVTLGSKQYDVEGLAWMDHEFFTEQPDPSTSGWDWMYVQLDDGSELMVYRLRRKDGSADPYSSGTYVDPQGRSRHLTATDFSFEPEHVAWTSPDTGATYPMRWRLIVPSLSIELGVTTPLETQEFKSTNRLAPSYWEGAIDAEGKKSALPTKGIGYLEMVGYEGRH